MMGLKSHQWGGIIALGTVVMLTLAALAPLWLPSAQKPLYYVVIPEGFIGPVSLIYPIPNGVTDYQVGDDDHVHYYNLPAEQSYLLVQDRPPEGAHIAFASRNHDGQLKPLVFYSKGYGGNDLYFAESRGLKHFLLPESPKDSPSLVEARFVIYDRRDPRSLTTMSFEDGQGQKISQKARSAAFQAIKEAPQALPQT